MHRFSKILDDLQEDLDGMTFSAPVEYVYNPLGYARAPLDLYLERYAVHRPQVVLLGMNPGPWGMMQTGIPFGEVELARDWLGLEASVGEPPQSHPKRPVLGFACTRREVSGKRLWSWAHQRFGSPDSFFQQFLVWNYCPLGFLDQGGRNVTPDKISRAERQPLLDRCDQSLGEMLDLIGPKWVVGVGKFAEKQALRVCANGGVEVGSILHPSPASPAANRGWQQQAERQLAALGVTIPGAG